MKNFAPELLSKVGKVSVVSIFIILAAIAVNAWFNVTVDFEIDYFLTDERMAAY